MASAGSGIQYRRYRAPRNPGEVFSDPPLADVPQLARSNAAKLCSSSLQLGGQPVSNWMPRARSELFDLACRYTRTYRDVTGHDAFDANRSLVLLTGHQPRLFHPGVWYKNFALDRLAKSQRAVAIHLIVDNDATGSSAIRVPTGTATSPALVTVPYDASSEATPFEERSILDPMQFASFADRVEASLQGLIPDPLIRDWWPTAVDVAKRVEKLGLAISQARHILEGRWGLETLELPLSSLCGTHTFGLFLGNILDELPRFVETYNRSLSEYRQVHHIRSRSHPVPALQGDDSWWEAPCWIWTARDPRRKRLFVRRMSDGLELADRDSLQCRLPRVQSDAGASWLVGLADLAAQGIKVRPRALLTTMYVRLVLCDLFVHGIGGGKYDQLTDAIIERFFLMEPPQFLVLSATLQLPIARTPFQLDDLRCLDQRLRDLRFNPDRYVARSAETQVIIDSKQNWLASAPLADSWRPRHRGIEAANAALWPHVEASREKLLAEREELLVRMRNDKVLGSREFAFCLFPAPTLHALLLDKC